MQVMGPDWLLIYKQTKVHMWNDYNSNKQKCQVFIKHAQKSSNAVFKKPSRLKLKAKTF